MRECDTAVAKLYVHVCAYVAQLDNGEGERKRGRGRKREVASTARRKRDIYMYIPDIYVYGLLA